MNDNCDRVRMFVFHIWILTLIVILLVFVVAYFSPVTPPFSSTLQSLEMLTGLVLPQIGIMTAFYFNLDAQRNKLNSLTADQIAVVITLSVLYHVVCIFSVIAGVGFHAFDRTSDPDSALVRNTAAVVSIMGLFSLLLAPIAFLFSKPEHNAGTPNNDDTPPPE